MKKRLIDFTLKEMQLLIEDYRKTHDECVINGGFCGFCKYKKFCNINIFDIDFTEEFEVPKLKPKLNDVEKMILENVAEGWKWIARDEDGHLYLYSVKPQKRNTSWDCSFSACDLGLFNHLLQFIKWEDEEPYCIEELLK